MSSTLALAGLTVIATSGLISLALILRFLWRVYDRGGPTHVRSAAAALRQVYDPNWQARLGRFFAPGEEKKPARSNREETAAMREWAQAHGHKVNDRGASRSRSSRRTRPAAS